MGIDSGRPHERESFVSELRKTTSPGDPVIPDKLYFRIGEVARLLGVQTHTLRFWESEFPQVRVGKGGTGQRLYRRRDVETLLEIKHLLYSAGYTIPGARQMLESRNRRRPAREAAPPTPAEMPVGTNGRDAGLQRLRLQLRELSAQLSRPVPGGSSRTERTARRWAKPAERGGIHLAGRSGQGVAVDGQGSGKPGAFPFPNLFQDHDNR